MSAIVYIDMDGVLCDFEGAYYRDLAAYPEIDFPQSRKGFYENLTPIDGSQDAMQYLLEAKEIEPYILSLIHI